MDHLKLIEKELGGGKISKDRISLIETTNATELTISGLRQDTFEYLVDRYGNKFSKINFWKCPRVEDLTPLETLNKVTSISWFWNLKANSLWDLSKNTSLKYLHLRDFQNVRTISELSKSNTLEELDLDGGMWRKSQIDSLEPLTKIDTLKALTFSTRLADKRTEPMTRMKSLAEVHFGSNVFTTEQIAWLTSKIGGQVLSEVLAPYKNFGRNLNISSKGEKLDTLVIGKQKPFLDSTRPEEKLDKYTEKFDKLVNYYQENSSLAEPL